MDGLSLREDSHGCPVRRSFKGVQLHHVFDEHRTEWRLVGQEKTSEALASTGGLKETLRQDEPELSTPLEVAVNCDVSHEHGNVLLAFPKDRIHAPMREQTVMLPERLALEPVIIREAFPIHPWGVANDVMTGLEEKRSESILDDPCPNAVQPTLMQLAELSV